MDAFAFGYVGTSLYRARRSVRIDQREEKEEGIPLVR